MVLSIVIPMYNAESTIVSALDSILRQSYQGIFEVIVVNDGSSDGSREVVKQYTKNLSGNVPEIHLIDQPNSGVSAARNRGIKVAKGDWVALLDSDDEWLPDKLEEQLNVVRNNKKIRFIGCNRNGEVYPYFGKKNQSTFELTAHQILMKWYPQTSTVLMSKELLNECLFDENRSHGEDGDLWLRVLMSDSIFVLNQNLVHTGGGKRHFGQSGLSANLSKMFYGEIRNLNDALRRNQINLLSYIFFLPYMTLKYVRRIIITKFSSGR
ncbi:glycosyltransferase family 2 protein [Vibrio ostreicida]|uniref:Glycosyltransferase family A protein n=1 Tax=Vibrio ostreicida TaxID=526588 RepID=A0ABT8BNN0_9VIBR|nr:glycosyltransferase family A protein [Vibrio ostreicida]MDN3608476.1 glycosyltransferase family A protein [Vibrio ostreicida]NPD10298.1 glycosyltransferase family 2 protein [Vibrio ostreicida]